MALHAQDRLSKARILSNNPTIHYYYNSPGVADNRADSLLNCSLFCMCTVIKMSQGKAGGKEQAREVVLCLRHNVPADDTKQLLTGKWNEREQNNMIFWALNHPHFLPSPVRISWTNRKQRLEADNHAKIFN